MKKRNQCIPKLKVTEKLFFFQYACLCNTTFFKEIELWIQFMLLFVLLQ